MRVLKDRARTVQDADGRVVEIVAVDAEEASTARLDLALRTLARLMVRSHRENGDPAANASDKRCTSALTVVPQPSPDHGDEDAA